MRAMVYVVSIGIKDGWYDIIHAFSNREAAETYTAWQREITGDSCYITPMPVEDGWTPDHQPPPQRVDTASLFTSHESWLDEDGHRHLHWDDEADNWRRCEARHY
jgi:hypothetical protein